MNDNNERSEKNMKNIEIIRITIPSVHFHLRPEAIKEDGSGGSLFTLVSRTEGEVTGWKEIRILLSDPKEMSK